LDPARYASRYPAALSGGERQRVGVARALAADPPVLLMDEPFGAVDPIVRERLQNELLKLQERLAKTILFVTHDIDEAIKMGDLVAVMQLGGHLAQYATPDEILASPANDFVGRFVGADRGLKRLALVRVGSVDLQPVSTVVLGSDAATARRRAADGDFPYLLLVDDRNRPIEWRRADSLPAGGAVDATDAMPAAPIFDRHTTLKDAFSMLLASDVQAGIVVDDAGAVRGLVTEDMISERIRAGSAAG
jgi:osmoprotectant transport system ATP-binding protein